MNIARRTTILPFAAAMLFALARVSHADSPEGPAQSLAAHFAALQSVKTLQADFTCEKRLALLESPLVSHGTVTIARPDSVRFSTLTPYQSELILHNGKVLAKSQHETEWTITNQSGRPGLTAVMGQLGNWSLGNPGDLSKMYAISVPPAGVSIPAEPKINDTPNAATQPAAPTPTIFVLTPTNKDLQKSLKEILLALDPQTHQLLFVRITTQQADITRYWFSNVRLNAPLSADTFAPADPHH